MSLCIKCGGDCLSHHHPQWLTCGIFASCPSSFGCARSEIPIPGVRMVVVGGDSGRGYTSFTKPTITTCSFLVPHAKSTNRQREDSWHWWENLPQLLRRVRVPKTRCQKGVYLESKGIAIASVGTSMPCDKWHSHCLIWARQLAMQIL